MEESDHPQPMDLSSATVDPVNSELFQRVKRSKFRCKRKKRRRRKNELRRKEKKKSKQSAAGADAAQNVAPLSSASGASAHEACQDCVFCVVGSKRRIVRIEYICGDWNGRQPRGYRKDNSWCRKSFERVKRRLMLCFVRQKRFLQTGVVVLLAQGDEYRTTRNCPCVSHRILDERVDRKLATTAEESNLFNSPAWKVLYCPVCDALHPRDQTAALAGAMNNEQQRLAESFEDCPAVSHGYQRRH